MIRRFLICLYTFGFFGCSLVYAQQNTAKPVHSQGLTAIDKAYATGRISLDQKVLYQLYAIYQPEKIAESLRSEITYPIKCGTPIVQEVQKYQQLFSGVTGAKLKSMLATPDLPDEQTYQSPGGNFVIHYTTTGDSAVSATDNSGSGIPDYVEWVAAAADSSWRHEVQTLGYTNPVLGPSQPYHIYILNLANYYGDTVQDGNTTFIRIENDFSEDFPPNDDPEGDQRGAIKVTIAHELKHAIQYAATRWQGESDLWAEMDATLMEEVVYDNVNDYYNYLGTSDSIFNSPQTSFYPGSYYHVSWALFFEEKYGSEFWAGVWDRIETDPTIHYTEAMSQELGSELFLKRDFTESQLWHFASGANTPSNYGFEEGANYPDPSVENNNSFYTTDFSIPRTAGDTRELEDFSALYFQITPPGNSNRKVILEISTEDEHAGTGLIAYFKDGTADTRIYTSEDSGAEIPIERPDWDWNDLQYIGLVLANHNTETSSQSSWLKIGSEAFDNLTLSQNYPNPFSSETRLRFTLAERTRVQIKLYDVTGRLVKILIDETMDEGLHDEPFTFGNLASGVYFYQLATDEETLIKKMTLIK